MFGEEKTCQISQGLITVLMTTLKPLSSVYYTIQNLVLLSTLKDQFSLLLWFFFFFLMLETIRYKEVGLSWAGHQLLKYLPLRKKKIYDWNPVTKEMV